MREWLRLAGIGEGGTGRIVAGFWNGEQFAGLGDVVGARAAGEQAVVADAGGSLRQHGGPEPAGGTPRGGGDGPPGARATRPEGRPLGGGTPCARGGASPR